MLSFRTFSFVSVRVKTPETFRIGSRTKPQIWQSTQKIQGQGRGAAISAEIERPPSVMNHSPFPFLLITDGAAAHRTPPESGRLSRQQQSVHYLITYSG